MLLLHLLFGLYLLGAAVSITLFYDRDDGPLPLLWAFIWPVFSLIAVAAVFSGVVSLIIERFRPPPPPDIPPEDSTDE
jgi:hypothetical protein